MMMKTFRMTFFFSISSVFFIRKQIKTVIKKNNLKHLKYSETNFSYNAKIY